MKGRGRKIPAVGEVAALRAAGAVLERAVAELGSVDRAVADILEETHDALARPNLRRAAQQVRTALVAAAGARRSLDRRLELAVKKTPPRRTS
jgi:hypothetical protein